MSETRDLATVVKEYGLSTTKAQAIIDGFADVFVETDRWEKAARDIVVTDESQTHLMAAARVLRLEIKARRVAVDKTRVKQKEDALREGKAIDGIANVLKGLMVPLEKYFGEQEDFAKIREEARDTERREKAERLLAEQEEREAAEEALAKAKRVALIEAENERLRVEAEKREKAAARESAKIAKEREGVQKAHAAAMAAERAEREKVENERAAERAEADARSKEESDKRAEAQAKVDREREKERLAAGKRTEKDRAARARTLAAHEKELAAARAETARLAALVKCPECGHTFDGREHPGE